MSWVQRLFKRGKLERELDKELAYHMERRTAELVAQGTDPQEAARRVRLEFGGADEVKEACRDARGTRWLEDLLQDCRYAFRTMAGNRTFSILAILSLALGIGANTAIYSFMDSILLRSLPVKDPESLVMLTWTAKANSGRSAGRTAFVMHSVHTRSGSSYTDPSRGEVSGIFPYAGFELFHNDDSVFASVFAHYQPTPFNLSVKGQADIASGEFVSGDFFRSLGISSAAGRMIVSEDDRAGEAPVAVLSYGLSEKRFGGPAQAVGQTILVNNTPITVVGVTPPEFFGVNPGRAPDFYLPMHANLLLGANGGWFNDPNVYWIEIMARLRPGVTIAQAQAEWSAQFHQWVASTAANDEERANLPALAIKEGGGGLDVLRRRYSKPLYVLMTLVALILAIACANIANLLLSRAAARGREMALRLSVGAGRLRIVRQLLTESLLLAAFGGALGVLFAIWGIRFLTLLLANGQTNFVLNVDLNWHVLGAAAALSILTGVLFGLAPAIQSTRVDVLSALKETRAGQPRVKHSIWRVNLSHALVVGQIALSLLMLVGAGLFVRTLSNLQSIDVGFNRENILLFQLNARLAGHQDPEISAFYGDLRKRFSTIPGVRNASLAETSLIEAGTSRPIGIPGTPPNRANRILTVGPAFFTTMQIPILAGRDIEERDRPGSPPVAVINEVFAKANFGDRNPLGQHLLLSGNPRPREMEIVGVTKNARYGGLKQDIPPVVYFPYDQGFPEPAGMVYAMRTAGDPLALVNTVREIVHQADERVPVSNVRTQTAEIDQTINQSIIFAKLCTAFAILALVIACVGLYGSMSYNVARRTSEIGIRVALGAKRGAVVWMVLREVLLLAVVGLAISLPIAFGTSRFVESFLFGLKHNDPLALALAVATLLCAALLAGYFPARRASRIDPMIALRNE